MSVLVVGAGAVSAAGVRFRGLLRELRQPGDLPAEVPDLSPAEDAGDARARKLMSRAARLGAIAQREALRSAGWAEGREEMGAWFGVGASGVSMTDVPAILSQSLTPGELSLERLGREGLAACNPLFTFQTLNNFTLCHGAILEGLQGPNGAFFSRGSGTALALAEALWALQSGECERALAGGADTALHPVTRSELKGFVAQGLQPGEGAAALALARSAPAALCTLRSARLLRDGERCAAADLIVLAPWGPPARARLLQFAPPGAELLDLSQRLGDALAASPALAWVVAVDALVSGAARSVLVLSLGIDGVPCAAEFAQ